MSFKEVKELRLAGKLEEALQLAQQLMEKDSENIWNKRAMGWVYYEYLKLHATVEGKEQFIDYLNKIKELNFPETEQMLYNTCAYPISSLIYVLVQEKAADNKTLDQLFEIVQSFHFTKPSNEYSILFSAFQRTNQEWLRYTEFVDWWELEHLRPDDYLEEEYQGRQIMSLAEQAYIAYSRWLLKGEPAIYKGIIGPFKVNQEKIAIFFPKLEKVVETYPSMQYPPYYMAKLLVAIQDDKSEALAAYIPFAKRKRNVFWAWDVMAELHDHDKDMQIACYCKALSLGTDDKFLVNTRENFAALLIEKGLYNEAKTEIQQVLSTRQKENWKKLSKNLQTWPTCDWYKNATVKADNKDFYKQHLSKAEALFYKDRPEELVVVEFVNRDKGFLNFVKDKQKFGSFRYNTTLDHHPVVGDVLKVRFANEGKEGKYWAIEVAKMPNDTQCDAIKKVSDKFTQRPNQNYGFVGDVFVPPHIISSFNLTDGQQITVKAILSYNRLRKEVGWKAIEIL